MPKYIIIGASAAGLSAARVFLNHQQLENVIIFEANGTMPLNKCFFADVLAKDKKLDAISVLPEKQLEALQERVVCNTRVSLIDRKEKTVLIDDGRHYSYDTLLVATGTQAIIPPQLNVVLDYKRVFSFHSTHDIHMLAQVQERFSGVDIAVIGSGLSGLECADSLRELGASVTIIERASQLFPALQNDSISAAIAMQAQKKGIACWCSKEVVTVRTGSTGVTLTYNDNQAVQYDYLFVCTGQRPAAEMILKTGLDMSGGLLVVDHYLQSSDESLFAVGDVACVPHAITAFPTQSTSWADAMHQGLIAAQNMLGAKKVYTGVLPTISSAFFGYRFASFDAPLLQRDSDQGAVSLTTGDQIVILKPEKGLLRAYAAYGMQSLHGVLRRSVLSRTPFDDILRQLQQSLGTKNASETTTNST